MRPARKGREYIDRAGEHVSGRPLASMRPARKGREYVAVPMPAEVVARPLQ